MKRILAIATAVLVLALPAFSADKAKVTLTQMVSQGWITEADEELAAMFTKETGIGIEWQVTPAAQHHDLLKTKLNAGEAPDIFWIQSNKWAVKTEIDVAKNCIDFSKEAWVKTMPAAKIESVSLDGKVYGQGYYIKGISFPIVYNKTLFKQYSLSAPKSWADFKKICETFKKAGIVPVYEAVPAGWHHVLWVMQIGGRYAELQPGVVEALNANKLKLADVKSFVTAISQLQEMAKSGWFGPDYMANSLDSWAGELATRKAAMNVNQAGEINRLKSDYPDCADEFGVFVIPLADNQLSHVDPNGPARFGYAKSKYKAEIAKYFEFLARKENLQYKLDKTVGWTAIDVADSVGINQHYLPAEKELFASNPKTGSIWQAAVSYVNDQWMEVGKDLASMFMGQMTPEQVVKAMDERRARIAKAAGDPAWK